MMAFGQDQSLLTASLVVSHMASLWISQYTELAGPHQR